jgi:hypothetical protein
MGGIFKKHMRPGQDIKLPNLALAMLDGQSQKMPMKDFSDEAPHFDADFAPGEEVEDNLEFHSDTPDAESLATDYAKQAQKEGFKKQNGNFSPCPPTPFGTPPFSHIHPLFLVLLTHNNHTARISPTPCTRQAGNRHLDAWNSIDHSVVTLRVLETISGMEGLVSYA